MLTEMKPCQSRILFLCFLLFRRKKNSQWRQKELCEHFQKPIIISRNEIMMKVTGRSFFYLVSAARSDFIFLFPIVRFFFSSEFLLHHSENENLKQRWKFLSEQTVKRQKIINRNWGSVIKSLAKGKKVKWNNEVMSFLSPSTTSVIYARFKTDKCYKRP